jgi:hypothetical protein
MTRASTNSRQRQGADTASHATLCNPFLPEREGARPRHGANRQEPRVPKDS